MKILMRWFSQSRYGNVFVERCPRDVQPGRIIDAARQLVVRQRGQAYLSADEIPELLDPELPQQLLVSAFRRYRR